MKVGLRGNRSSGYGFTIFLILFISTTVRMSTAGLGVCRATEGSTKWKL